MSLSLNKVIIAGNLTRDVEMRFLNGEKAIANFSIAINRKSKVNDGQAKEEVLFIDVEAWGRIAETAAQYLHKGSGCLVEGRLKMDAWDDKETGAKRTKIKVVAELIHFTDAAKTGATDAAARETAGDMAPARQATRPVSRSNDDEPPF